MSDLKKEEKEKLAKIGVNLWGSKNKQEENILLQDKQPEILAKDFSGFAKGVSQIYK